MLTIATIAMAAATLTLLAVAAAYVLGWADQQFYVYVDPKVTAICSALPGANCGGCGFVGCREYAEDIAAGDADISLCAPGGVSCAERYRIDNEVQVRFSHRICMLPHTVDETSL